MRRRLRTWCAYGLVALTALLSGCGLFRAPAPTEAVPVPPAPKRPILVGFSQMGAASAWRTAQTRSVLAEAARRGIHLKFSDAQQRQVNQVKAVRAFVEQKVDAIILAPLVETGWDPVLRHAKDAGIPMILVDRGTRTTDESLYATAIVHDFAAEGRLAGEWLVKRTGGKCRIVQLEGVPGADVTINRKKGFIEAAAKHAGMSIVASQSADFTRAEGRRVMAALIQAHGKGFDAVYAHNDDMALGAIQALQEAGTKPGRDVLVVSIDGTKDAFLAMVDGTLNATVECSPEVGPYVFDALEKLLRGEPVPRRIIVRDRLFEQSEAAELIKTRPY